MQLTTYRSREFIHTEKIQRILKFFDGIEYMLAGGYPLHCVLLQQGIRIPYSDLDFFFQSEEEFKKAELKMLNTCYLLFDSNNAITYEIYGIKIQLIKGIDTFDNILESFDFINSKVFFLSENINKVYFTKNVDLTLLSFNRLDIDIKMMERIVKYTVKKGLNISKDGTKIVLKSLSELFDLPLLNGTIYVNNLITTKEEEKQYYKYVFGLFLSSGFWAAKMIQNEKKYFFPFDQLDLKYSLYPFIENSLTYRYYSHIKSEKSLEFMKKYHPEHLI